MSRLSPYVAPIAQITKKLTCPQMIHIIVSEAEGLVGDQLILHTQPITCNLLLIRVGGIAQHPANGFTSSVPVRASDEVNFNPKAEDEV